MFSSDEGYNPKELLAETLAEAQRIGAEKILIESGRLAWNIYMQIVDYKREYKCFLFSDCSVLIEYIKSFTTFDSYDTEEQTGICNITINGENQSFYIKLSTKENANELSIILDAENSENTNNDEFLPYINEIYDNPSNFDIGNIPILISDSFENIKKLNSKVENAKKRQSAIKKRVANAFKIADEAKECAAYLKEPGLFKNKSAIESLQKATKSIAEAVEESSDVQCQSAQSQKDLLEIQEQTINYQKKLTQISKALLLLGASNRALNRSIFRELQITLNGASKEEIGELAHRELESVLHQLKEQQDILQRIETLDEKQQKSITTLRTLNLRNDLYEKEFQQVNSNISNISGYIENEHDKLNSSIERLDSFEKMIHSASEHIARVEADYHEKFDNLNSLIVSLDYFEKVIRKINLNISDNEKVTQSFSEHIATIESDYHEELKKINSLIIDINSLGKEIQQINVQILNIEDTNQDVSNYIKVIEENEITSLNFLKQNLGDQAILIENLQKQYDDILNNKGKGYWISTIISLLALIISIIHILI